MFGEMAAPVLSLLAQKGGVGLPGHHCQGGRVGPEGEDGGGVCVVL